MKTRTRALAAGSIAALCLAPLSACGSSPAKAGSPDSSVSSTPKLLTKADFAQRVSAAVRKAKTAHMTMDLAGTNAEGDMSYAGAMPEMTMTMTQQGQKINVVVADGAMYMKAPGLTQGDKWAKIDKNTPGLGQLIGSLSNFGPAEQIEMMQKGIKQLKPVKKTTIDGTPAEEYAVSVDPGVAAKSMKLPGSLSSQMPKSVTYDIWVDNQDLMRRLDMTISGQHIKMDVSDWGKPVHISVPPASQVQPLKMPGM